MPFLIFHSSRTSSLIAACDLPLPPFAHAELFKAESGFIVKKEADVVIAKTNKGYEPLHTVYSRATCIPAIEAATAFDKWGMDSWFPQVKNRMLTPDEIKRYDPDGLAFSHINPAEEIAQSERRVSGQSTPGTKRD